MRIHITGYKNIITVIGISVITALLIIFLIIPSMREMNLLKEAIKQERDQLSRKLRAGKTLKKALEDYEYIQPSLPSISKITLKRGEELNFINKIETLAEELSLEMKLDFNTELLSQKNKKETLINIPVTIQTDGKFINTLFFVERLEKNETLFLINNVRIASNVIASPRRSSFQIVSPQEQETPSGVHAEIQMITFWE